jgi:hypothetical protein
MSMVGFPLLLIPIAIYNIIAFLMPGVSFGDPLVRRALVSGAEWTVTLGDMLVALGVLMLLLEVIKGARPGAKYLTDHLLSLIVFGGAAAEFLMWPKFASSTYFLLTLLAMTDFLTGIALRTRRSAQMPARAMLPLETADHRLHEPRLDPAPAEPEAQLAAPAHPVSDIDSAASIAESVLMDHPEPKIAQPQVAAREPKATAPEPAAPEHASPEPASPEPKIHSPELQPGSGSLAG